MVKDGDGREWRQTDSEVMLRWVAGEDGKGARYFVWIDVCLFKAGAWMRMGANAGMSLGFAAALTPAPLPPAGEGFVSSLHHSSVANLFGSCLGV